MRAIDLFAGWGGFTLGAELAGVDVVYAANHWPVAVDVHGANHPRAEHVCQDLRQADWTRLPAFELLLASPACQGHSEAAQPSRKRFGVQRKHDADRATAWAVVDCAEVTRPRAIVVENVPRFASWTLFPVWRLALEKLGYHVQELRAVASIHGGVPQRRERLFVVASRSGKAVELAASTEPPFGPCVEIGANGWRNIGAASPDARARFAKARARHGRRFLSQHVTGHPGVPLHEPIRTITCASDHWVLVDGDRYRPLTSRELARGMGFPDSYTWPAFLPSRLVTRGLGNAVPPGLARAVVSAVLEAA